MNEAPKRSYIKAKRKLVDNCNICSEVRKLTYDHVPPMCCFNDMRSFPAGNEFSEALGDSQRYLAPYAQNGVKFRTICERCNNTLLGRYDKEIECFVDHFKRDYEHRKNLTECIDIPCRVNRISRAICGHLLAIEDHYDSSSVNTVLREYVQCNTNLPPAGYKLLMRFYPYSTVFFMRNIAVYDGDDPTLPDGIISILSAFPVAYILSDGKNDCGMFDLFSVCTTHIDDIKIIPFDYGSMMHPDTRVLRDEKWPCITSNPDNPIIITTEEASAEAVYARRDADLLKEKLL